jgi:hypothetical protein
MGPSLRPKKSGRTGLYLYLHLSVLFFFFFFSFLILLFISILFLCHLVVKLEGSPISTVSCLFSFMVAREEK